MLTDVMRSSLFNSRYVVPEMVLLVSLLRGSVLLSAVTPGNEVSSVSRRNAPSTYSPAELLRKEPKYHSKLKFAYIN